jgi:hypothetical protein
MALPAQATDFTDKDFDSHRHRLISIAGAQCG